MKEKVLENIKTAVRTEIEGYNFYITASNIMKDEHGKSVFSHLAKEELEHISALTAISRSLESSGEWLAYQNALDFSRSSAPIFLEENELIKRLKQNPSQLNAVTIATEAEEKAVDFYSGLLKTANVPDEKAVLGKILDMEKNHLKLLTWERGAIMQTGFWADFMEFNIEKERE
ncbi:MAG: ferritin family protein [Deltaproteobacteria bacterium]|nr:ferritin family protein [Deltaproteobacteria bacterium]